MAKLSVVSKIFLFLAILFFSLFLGGYVARQMIVYQLFEPNSLDFKSLYTDQNLGLIYATMMPVLVLNLVTYSVFVISSIFFLITSRVSLKYEGWLFVIIIILVVTAPFEIYLSSIDFKIVSMIMANYSPVSGISLLIKERMTVLSSFSLIEIFSFAAIIFLYLFRPLRKQNEN